MATLTMAEANRRLKLLPEAARLEVQDVANVTAFQVVAHVRPQLPVGTGIHGWQSADATMHLRDAVDWQPRAQTVSAVVRVNAEAFYWRYLEYGTKFIAARGSFRAAGDALREDHRRRLLRALERAETALTR